MRQVDVLMDMIIKQFFSVPVNGRDKTWFENLESSLYLLEETYSKRKDDLVAALEKSR